MKTQWWIHLSWISALIVYHMFNPLRIEHIGLLAGVIIAWHVARVSREFVLVFLPLMIYGLIYDLLRLFAARAHEIVTIGEVREFELALFGWSVDGVRIGPVEYLQNFQTIWLDVVGSVWYASHVATIIAFGVFLWLYKRPEAHRLHCFLWGFLFVNLIGFTIQILFPVAPPWYVELYGYAQPTTLIGGDPAGLGRVDDWLGIEYFDGVYGQAAYVFGAVPSLHMTYPVWLALFTRRWWSRTLAWGYALIMGFFAVYFVHHYVVDLIAGVALALLGYLLLMKTQLRTVPGQIFRWLHAQFMEQESSYAPHMQSQEAFEHNN